MLAVLVTLAIPALASCGGGSAESAVISSDAPATTAASASVTASADGAPTPHASEDTTVGVGNDVPLPGNWPAAIPAYEGGSLVSVVVVGDGSEINATWLTDASTPEAAADMDAAMKAAGFTSGVNATASGMSSVDYAGNGYTVNITVYTSGDQSNVSINASKDA